MQPSTTAAGLGPLSDIVIVDLTRVLAGPFATMALADLGARVIKVEPPSRGDDARHFGPFTGGDGDAAGGKSVYFESLNRGKQSIALDLKATDDRAVFEKLVAAADVLVENYRAGTMEKLNYGWEALRRINPQLIYAAVSGFGQTGPYRHLPAYDLVVQAMFGKRHQSLLGRGQTAGAARHAPSVDYPVRRFQSKRRAFDYRGRQRCIVQQVMRGVGRGRFAGARCIQQQRPSH